MRLWPSEVGWQSFCIAAARDKVPQNKLRTIIMHFVVEKQTRMVIFEAARNSSFTQSGADGYRVYTEHDNGFFAILGSVLGSSAVRILSDHKRDIGYRTVERIVVFGKTDEGEDYDKAKSLQGSRRSDYRSRRPGLV